MKKVEIFDSTLRDGAQGEGISFSVEDKLAITHALDELGIAYIEAGNPGSNPKDLEFFQRVGTLRHATLCAFGSTRRANVRVEDDKNVRALETANTPAVVLFGKSWDLHVTDVLHTSLEENLNMIRETVAYFKKHGKEVFFDSEHFFDGCTANRDYAYATLKAACEGGADVLCLCDTRGAAYPTEIATEVRSVCETFGRRVAIHSHNDTGMAVADALLAVDAGAAQVQGTMLGIGERCGNANLTTVIADLQLKRGVSCVPEEQLGNLTSSVRRIAEICNVTLPAAAPYVGTSAFAHKGGMHVDGVMKVPRSFEHVTPESVGNERRFLLSEVSGRTTVLPAVQRVDPTLTKSSPEVKAVVARIKELEFEGYQFEGAQATVDLLIRKVIGVYKPFFELEQYKIICEQPPKDGMYDTAVIRLKAFGQSEISAAQGDGPVHALDLALKKALTVFYPAVKDIHLTDYKVRVMESRSATASKVRVLIETTDGDSSWSTVGVSTDIIAASWIALVDSIEYKLIKDQAQNEQGKEPA